MSINIRVVGEALGEEIEMDGGILAAWGQGLHCWSGGGWDLVYLGCFIIMYE